MSLIDPFGVLQKEKEFSFYSLPMLAKKFPKVKRLPVSLQIILESMLRNCDGQKVKKEDVLRLCEHDPKEKSSKDIPFCVARVILQDFTGVPLLVDLAAMRDAIQEQGKDPSMIEPKVPVDLVIDHSVQVDKAGTKDSFAFNLSLEFQRNKERYEFMKWGQEAFSSLKVVPPGIGIVHQVNLEKIAPVVMQKEGLCFFDTVVGTDSHTTMINGLGVIGWGVGGIEAEAAMLGQPISLEIPEVIGFCLEGRLGDQVTATDLTLEITEILRKEKVVGKFIEFFGEGAQTLSVADRSTIGNMAPEYGATIGYFPVDEKTIEYLLLTGRSKDEVQRVENYWKLQGLFGISSEEKFSYTKVLKLNLSKVRPCVAGPKRPQDRIVLDEVKSKFLELFEKDLLLGGYGKKKEDLKKVVSIDRFAKMAAQDSGGSLDPEDPKAIWSEEEMSANRPYTNPVTNPGYTEREGRGEKISHGSIVIAAITSCTNTSNPKVMMGAGILAKKAVQRGLKTHPIVKTSLAPGSRVVTDYLEKAKLQSYLDQLGFHLVAYGCTTCIGNSGPLDETIEAVIKEHDFVVASVLSGNRNFEARVHGSVKANFLMSPPLVVAYAIAGRVDIDLTKEPLGYDLEGRAVFLQEIWPSEEEIEEAISLIAPEMFTTRYAHILTDNPIWNQIGKKSSCQYAWDQESTYIRKPPYFEGFTKELPKKSSYSSLCALSLFKDSVTTDHISPAGSFKQETPAGKYLVSKGISPKDFNSYGSRRGNHEVMMRGTFANVRIRNALADGKEGGFTKIFPEGKIVTIYDAAAFYKEQNRSLIIFAGKDYGMGSSRDWAAKGTLLLGVRAVVAESFERIHRSNLVGMGILPLKFLEGQSWESLKIKGSELFHLKNLETLSPKQPVILEIEDEKGKREVSLISCVETLQEVEYLLHGGILPYVLRQYL